MKQPPRGPDLRTHAFTLLTQGILEGKPYERIEALRATKIAERLGK